ncbi:MAG: MFS transporter [Negativicutes bacterium]|nr:MFS transporter [Negativicutes bacterium]
MKTSTKVIIAVLFCYFVAWLDRMAISMALPYIGKEFNLSATALGGILSAFFVGYAGCQIPGGWLADKFGARRVITGALTVWSLFTALTGMVSNITQMFAVRFVFGAGEGVFPGPVWKIVGSWFSKKDRGTANSCVLTSTTLGPAITPLVVAPLIAAFGWRAVFFVLGGLGILCVYVSWRFIVDRPEEYPGISSEEVLLIKEQRAADEAASANMEQSIAPKASFWDLIKEPRIWVMFFGVFFLTVPIWGYMTWLPTYLVKVRGLSLTGMSIAASIPFFVATVGMLLSGWMSDRFFRGRRRYLVIAAELVGAFCLYLFYTTPSVEYATLYQSLAAGFLFMALGSIWALPVIYLPENLMGSGSGFVNTGGQLGGLVAPFALGLVIDWTGGNYDAAFRLLAFSCLISSLIIFFGIGEKKNPATPVAEAAGR